MNKHFFAKARDEFFDFGEDHGFSRPLPPGVTLEYFGGNGKSQTSTSSVQIPADVLARYNSVNAQAQQAAANPFQTYSGEFTAPVNAQESGAISGINNAAGQAQGYVPGAVDSLTQGLQQGQQGTYQGLGTVTGGQDTGSALYGASLGTAAAGANAANNSYSNANSNIFGALNTSQQATADASPYINNAINAGQPDLGTATNLTGQALGTGQSYAEQSLGYLPGATGDVNADQFSGAAINKFMSPYLTNVVGAEQGLLNQQNAQQLQSLKSSQIKGGAFGGDRAGIDEANLGQQQSLANSSILSGLLNQGYGQALSAFQQQQGVNLGAAQANRTAQQYGQQALANLGQQQFGQTLGAAQNYANLGNLAYTQMLGQGQAIAGLGQQQAATDLSGANAAANLGSQQGTLGLQQAGLQQAAAAGLFGQAYQTGNAQMAAGQNLFNMGQQAGTNYLNTGLQAQNAALQGNQAALTAGQLQQQTQQQLDTAQYNQFLQQQGYPFQVAQFLANIAEGTGALSGTTTTQTSPAPWWSDRRLKENATRVGRTDDGTPIYKYNYKNDPSKQVHLGMMADEVMKKHPEAVGEHQGFKTVDYDKATLGHRPHRASGGPISIEDLITSMGQPKSYGPFSGTSIANSKGYVPSAALPVGHLMVANPPPMQNQSNPLKDLGSSADTVVGLKKDYDTIKGWLPNMSSSSSPAPTGFGDFGGIYARGGTVSYADGGEVDPYGDGGGGYMDPIMKDLKTPPSLATAANPPGSNSSNSGSPLDALKGISSAVSAAQTLGSAASSAGSAIMDFLPMIFAKNGGAIRPRYAGGGGTESDDTTDLSTDPSTATQGGDDTIDRIMHGVRQVESSHNYGAIGQPTHTGDRGYGAYQVMGNNIPTWTKGVLGNSMSPQEFLDNPDAQDAVARAKLGSYYEKYGTPEDAASMWFSGKPLQGNNRSDGSNTVPQYVAKFRDAMNNADSPESGAVTAAGVGTPASAKDLSWNPSSDKKEEKGFLSTLADKVTSNPDMILSLLSGLGTMASSNSRFLGASILQGLSGGAKTYQELQRQNSEIAKNSLGLLQSRFTQNLEKPGWYMDNFTGQPVSPQQYAEIASKQPGLSKLSVPTSTAPTAPTAPAMPGATAPTPGGAIAAPAASGPTAATAPPGAAPAGAPATPAPVANVSGTSLPASLFAQADPMANPVVLQKKIDESQAALDNVNQNIRQGWGNKASLESRAQALSAQIDKAKSLRERILKGDDPVVDSQGNVLDAPTRAIQTYNNEIANRKAISGQTPERVSEMAKEAQEFFPQSERTLQAINDMMGLQSKYGSNRGTGYWAEVGGILRSIPGVGEYITPDAIKKLQASYDTNNKYAIGNAFEEVAGTHMQRAAKAALKEALMTVATPTSDPTARYNMLVNSKAQIYADRQRYNDWMQAGTPDPLKFNSEWTTKGPGSPENYKKFYQQAADDVDSPYPQGSPDEGAMTHPKSEEGKAKMRAVQSGVPAPLVQQYGSQWQVSPSKPGLFRNKQTGDVFTADGKKVQ